MNGRLSTLLRALNWRYAAWQRNRPRWLRRRVFGFDPIPSGGDGAARLAVLCTPRQFADGCWSAWSWMRFLAPRLRLALCVDGVVSAAQRRAAERLFPGGEILEVPRVLAAQPPPSKAFAAFLARNWTARKLGLLLALQREGAVLYSDCDVLAFRPPSALLEIISAGARNAFMEDGEPCVDPWLRQEAQRLGLPLRETLNSGLLWIRERSLDPSVIEALLAGWRPEFNDHFSEQTLLAALFAATEAEPLPRDEYLVSSDGWSFWSRDLPCDRLTVRHYVGIVRHRMYSSALPFLARQARAGSRTVAE
jgi:hypothetical protein